jgi:hypothetical protein
LAPPPSPPAGEQVNDSNEINLDNFVKALEEEANAAAGFFGDGEAQSSGAARPVAAVVDELRKGTGINWALFTVDGKGTAAAAPTTLPAAAAAASASSASSAPVTSTGASGSTTAAIKAASAGPGKLAGGSWMKPAEGSEKPPMPSSSAGTKEVGKISVAASAMFGGNRSRSNSDADTAAKVEPVAKVEAVSAPAAAEAEPAAASAPVAGAEPAALSEPAAAAEPAPAAAE